MTGTNVQLFKMTETEIAQRLEETEEAIAILNDKYMALTVNGIEDKKGYDAVHEAKMDVKKRRVKVLKNGKAQREEALAFNKMVIKVEKRIVALLTPIEEHLQAEEQKIDAEKDRIKAEAAAQEALIQGRVSRLIDFKPIYDGQSYIVYGLKVSVELIKTCSDEQFNDFMDRVREADDKEKQRLETERQAKEAETERLKKIAAEQDAERLRLETIAKEQAAREVKVKAEQEELQLEKKRLADEKRHEEEIAKAKIEAAKKAKKETEERIKKEKLDAEKLAKEQAEKEAQRKALMPDKQKLSAFADFLDAIEFPVVSAKAMSIVVDAKVNLARVAHIIREDTEEL
ncbi:MAG: hypothetical protein WC373_11620 [Smithella sp.]|jgi:hypothetical protein